MRYVKILGLAAMALAALMAMAGTASATTITSPKGTTYTSTIKAENVGTVTLTSVFGGFGAVSCNKSTVEGKVEAHGVGVTVSGLIEAKNLTFTECNKPVTVVSGGSLELHALNPVEGRSKEGTLTSKNVKIEIHETAFGTCTFTTASTGTDIGTVTTTEATGGNAILDINAQIPSACGTGTWEGSYKVISPNPFYLDA